MLSKLLKYDLKYMIKNMGIFYILAFIFSIITRVLLNIPETTFISILSKISIGVIISICVSIVFNVVIRSWVRFNDSIYKDEAYLTHTLPVTKNQIFTSRVLEAFIFTIISFIVIAVSLFIAFYSKESLDILKTIITTIAVDLNLNEFIIICIFLLILFFEVFNTLLSGYIGIVLGNRKNDKKLAFTFIYGIITYFITQGFCILIIYILAMFNSDVMLIFTEANAKISSSAFISSSIVIILGYIALIFILDFIGKKLLSKGVNID